MINNSSASEDNDDSSWMMLSNDPHQASTSNDVAKDTSIDASERLSNDGNVVTDRRETDQDPIPCSSGDPNLFVVQDAELYVAEPLVKSLLLKPNYLLVDFLKDPNFRIFLERVCQKGVPASLLGVGDDNPVIEKSLMSYKEEVRRHILEVKESWKTTGCTLIVYNLNNRKGKFSDVNKDNNVLGFYSLKGFLFFEDLSIEGKSLSSGYVKHFIRHYDDDDDHIQSCCELCLPRSRSYWCDKFEGVTRNQCLRQEIQGMCSEICKGSQWLKGLFNKAEVIHHQIVNSNLRNRYYATLKKKELKEFQDGKQTSLPSSFVSIMLLEDELKTWLPNPICYGGSLEDAEIQAALNDSEFWIQGRLVQTALNLILEIPDLMDTLVPSAGYLKLAFDNVKRELNSCNRPHTPMLDRFWEYLDFELSDLYQEFNEIQPATYFNPAYFGGKEYINLSVSDVKDCIESFEGEYINEAVIEELERYNLRCSNPFANISQEERENTHPIKLWEKYGNAFPRLRKLAMKVLSQPVSCLCNQVKKHMPELEGADNLILRLNARMMEEFRNLGDDIYKPIDCKPSVHW